MKHKKKLLFILLPAVIVILLLAGIIYFIGFRPGKNIVEPTSSSLTGETAAEAKDISGAAVGTPSPSGGDTADVQNEAAGPTTATDAGSDLENNSDNGMVADNSVKPQDNPTISAASTPVAGSGTEPQDYDTITISAVGDLTLGRDINFSYDGSYDQEFELQDEDYGYFLRNVKDIFEADDLTVGNLETTLTTATKMAVKKFRFKGDPSYTEILKQGSVEVVSIANNHTYDYLEKGYKDTLANLNSAGIGYFGNDDVYVREIRGIKVGFLGYTYWEDSDTIKKKVKDGIKALRKEGADIVIVMYHWGIERDYIPYDVQIDMAHFTIDSGADLVLGSHPHVLQGIEEYKGKNIIYSLGNFCYGGNKNPEDKDTMIVVHKFNFENGRLVSEENEVVPCSISSVKDRNNYQPTPMEGSEKDRVLKKLEEISRF